MLYCRKCDFPLEGFKAGDPEEMDVQDIECPSCGHTDYYCAVPLET
jgi:rubrerythrin